MSDNNNKKKMEEEKYRATPTAHQQTSDKKTTLGTSGMVPSTIKTGSTPFSVASSLDNLAIVDNAKQQQSVKEVHKTQKTLDQPRGIHELSRGPDTLKSFSSSRESENKINTARKAPTLITLQEAAAGALAQAQWDGKCIPREPFGVALPISPIHVLVLTVDAFDEAMKAMEKALKADSHVIEATLDPKKGCINISLRDEEKTSIKVSGFRDRSKGIFVEFTRLEGCAFEFQRIFVLAKIAAYQHIDKGNIDTFKKELTIAEERLAFWNAPPLPIKS